MALFELRKVGKTYPTRSERGVQALDAIDLSIERGSMVALCGPSGAGKSTLLSLLGLLDRPTCGELRFDGHDLATSADVARTRARRRMAFVFQDYGLLAGLNGWENVIQALIPRGVPRANRRDKIASWFKKLKLLPMAERAVEEWSGGERQRLALARALACEPEVLLADEPTSNLDEETATVVFQALREYHERGGTFVVATHDRTLSDVATCLVRLRGGRCEGIESRS